MKVLDESKDPTTTYYLYRLAYPALLPIFLLMKGLLPEEYRHATALIFFGAWIGGMVILRLKCISIGRRRNCSINWGCNWDFSVPL